MKTCLGCKFAEWAKTNSGRLHPSGHGLCTYEVKIPALPNSKYWIVGIPEPFGGHISRPKKYKKHCPCYQQQK